MKSIALLRFLSAPARLLVPALLAAVLLPLPAAAEEAGTPAAASSEVVTGTAATAEAPSASVPAEPAPAEPGQGAGADAANPLQALETPDAEALTGGAGLAHDLSPWGMYLGADIVVKAVMIGLALASILTWTIGVAKGLELVRAKRRLRLEVADLKTARTLNQAADQARAKHSFSSLLIEDAQNELELSARSSEKEGIKERVSFRLERLVSASGRQMSQGTGILATIGSTAPFVGLFGTVWGIMNSFIGIAKSQTTNLAVVAPGIAEALLATALGLVAAIPAVVIYNVFARSITGYKAQVADASAQVLLLVSRDLDHRPPADRQSAPHAIKVG